MTRENPNVAAHAVIPNALPLHALSLIGVIQAGDTTTALIRTPRGAITKVKPGDQIGNQTVSAISDDSLILAGDNGTQTILHMPS